MIFPRNGRVLAAPGGAFTTARGRVLFFGRQRTIDKGRKQVYN